VISCNNNIKLANALKRRLKICTFL